mgnify:CR=1 FL=1
MGSAYEKGKGYCRHSILWSFLLRNLRLITYKFYLTVVQHIYI